MALYGMLFSVSDGERGRKEEAKRRNERRPQGKVRQGEGKRENVLIQPNALPTNALMFPPQVYLVEDEHVGYIQAECGREQVAAEGGPHDE